MHCIPPVPGVYEIFRQRFKRIFATTVKKEWAFRRKPCPGGFPHSPSAYRQGAREHPRGSPRKRSQRVGDKTSPWRASGALDQRFKSLLRRKTLSTPRKRVRKGVCALKSLLQLSYAVRPKSNLSIAAVFLLSVLTVSKHHILAAGCQRKVCHSAKATRRVDKRGRKDSTAHLMVEQYQQGMSHSTQGYRAWGQIQSQEMRLGGR
jgi:hypothetical protein